MSAPTPVEKFDSLLQQSKFVFAVCKSSVHLASACHLNRPLTRCSPRHVADFRGHWCPYCMAYLRTFASLEGPIAAAGGAPVIITAEDEVHLPATRATTGSSCEVLPAYTRPGARVAFQRVRGRLQVVT